MTTIVYKNGVIAADSLVTMGDHAVEEINKLVKIKDKYAIAFAGNMFAGMRIVDALRDGQDLHDLDVPKIRREDFCCIVSDFSDVYYLNNEFYAQKIDYRKPYAIGTGEQFTLGAMYAGADAIEALKIACKLDIRSGGKIKKVKLW